MREATIVRRVGKLFEEDGLVVDTEVPLGPKRIDLVAMNPHTGRVTAVEAKVSDWRAGLRQALMYRLCAHDVYVAVDHRFAHRLDLNALDEYGIGAIAVDGYAGILIKAQRSNIIHRGLLKEIRDHFDWGGRK